MIVAAPSPASWPLSPSYLYSFPVPLEGSIVAWEPWRQATFWVSQGPIREAASVCLEDRQHCGLLGVVVVVEAPYTP